MNLLNPPPILIITIMIKRSICLEISINLGGTMSFIF